MSTAVTGVLFFVPSVPLLESLADDGGGKGDGADDGSADDGGAGEPAAGAAAAQPGSLGIGSLGGARPD